MEKVEKKKEGFSELKHVTKALKKRKVEILELVDDVVENRCSDGHGDLLECGDVEEQPGPNHGRSVYLNMYRL